MNIELSKSDIELIDRALQEWESAPSGSALMGATFGMLFSPKDQRDQEKGRIDKEMEKASREVTERRITSTLLRAKLFQGLNRLSEFPEAKQETVNQ